MHENNATGPGVDSDHCDFVGDSASNDCAHTPNLCYRLQKNGIRVVMLTGDNRATAEALAAKAGISEFFAEVLPEDKANKVEQLQTDAIAAGDYAFNCQMQMYRGQLNVK